MDLPMPPYPEAQPSSILPPPSEEPSPATPAEPPGSNDAPRWKSPLVLGLVAGGLLLVFGVAVGAWWWLRPEPAAVVFAKAMKAGAEVKTVHSTFSGAVRLSGSDIPWGLQRIQVSGDNSIDVSALPEFKQSGAVTMSAVFDATSPMALAGLNNAAISMEMRMPSSKDVYLRLTNIPAIPLMNLEPVKNQWIEFRTGVVADFTGLAGSPLPPSAGVQSLGGLSQAWRAVTATADLAKSIQSVNNETVGGIPMVQYQMALTPQIVVTLLDAIVGKALGSEDRAVVMEQLTRTVGPVPMELWIGRKDYRIHKISASPSITAGQQKIAITLEQVMDRYNQPVTVDAPADAKPFAEVLGQIMGPSGRPAAGTPSAAASGPDNDFDGLSDDQERQLGTNAGNADTDGDGLTDGDEVNTYRSNPLTSDTDGDGLSDGNEAYRWRSDLLMADTDQDGYTDGQEVKNRYNPVGPGKMTPEQLRLVQ